MNKEYIDMPCLEYGAAVKVEKESLEHVGVLNVFCPDEAKDCEDKYAWKQ